MCVYVFDICIGVCVNVCKCVYMRIIYVVFFLYIFFNKSNGSAITCVCVGCMLILVCVYFSLSFLIYIFIFFFLIIILYMFFYMYVYLSVYVFFSLYFGKFSCTLLSSSSILPFYLPVLYLYSYYCKLPFFLDS